ncbi:recombinase family protein [Paenibacillus sp. SYP-B3998]|uniref:Recombinase family protein n=1 Tax=Paenibacillus sp. SYP-B3998 TaxID=2678564 RepID=A0A6G4A7E7_9BACL|nr:recombinase family protein [Paenibacillus sp. SYP-B3998]NEW09741.1 recombinase family protein [Paenibacillus sp. SYP-B3998]
MASTKQKTQPLNVLKNLSAPTVLQVVSYSRVSTEEQAELGFSIEAQMEEIRNRCKAEHKVVFKEFVDAGISGKSIEKRPALMQLLQDIESGKVSELWLWKTDRLSRRLSDLLLIMELLKRHNVTLRCVSDVEFDQTTSSGRAMMQMMGVMAEYQRNIIVENVKMGMKQRARNGKWNGGQVLGYDVVEVPAGSGKESLLRVNPIEAELVRKIFRMYASGQGLKGIANQLNHEDKKTKLGNAFSSVAVKTIINNPVYVGKIRYNVRENWSEKRRKGINPNPIVVDGEHDPIVSQDLWETVQALFAKKSFSPSRVFDGTYPLTGLLRCPQCGTTLGAHRVRDTLKDGTVVNRRYYVCNNFRNRGSRVCSSNSVKADMVESFVFERLAEAVQKPKILEDVVKKINKDRTLRVAPLHKELAAIEKELAAVDSQRKRFYKLFEMNGVDDELFVERLSELKVQQEQLSRRKAEAERQLLDSTSDPVPLQQVQQALAQFQSLLEEAPPETQKTLLQTVVKQVHMKDRRKVAGIELEFDPTVQKHFFELAPSAKTAEGAFAFRRQKSPSRYRIVL